MGTISSPPVGQDETPDGGSEGEAETGNNGEEKASRTSAGWRAKETPTEAVPEQPETTYTARFAGFVAFAGVLVAVGLATLNPAALAASGVLLVFILVGLTQTPPSPEPLRTTYEVTPQQPRPADTVSVSVTVENEGDSTFTDLRLVEKVPAELRVVGGSPRTGVTLGPGESTTIEYDVIARRGTYTFGPVVARTRTLVGSMWAQHSLSVDQQGELRCAVNAAEVPLEAQATDYVGNLLSQTGREGIEFYATREYHHGDPPSKINWRELAKRGELSTVTYREREAARITIVVDLRQRARVSAEPGEPTGASLAVYAAYQLATSLIDRGHDVGVTTPGLEPRPSMSGAFPYRRIDHGQRETQKQRVFELFEELADTTDDSSHPETHGRVHHVHNPAVLEPTTNTTIEAFVRHLTAWGTPRAQNICITPLLDEPMYRLCTHLQTGGASPVVISPDVTRSFAATSTHSRTPPTSGKPQPVESDIPARTVRVQRATRIESLRQRDWTVIDWDPAQPLSVCCNKQTRPGR